MRKLVLLYGVSSYLVFAATFAYFIAFVGGFLVPKSLASRASVDVQTALLIDTTLMLLWCLHHSVMARQRCKDVINRFLPPAIERSSYVLLSSLLLALLMYYWQPIDGTTWQVESTVGQRVIWLLFGLGWALSLFATFLTNHFDLFGLRQSWLCFIRRTYTEPPFKEYSLYLWIRHPMMLGMLIAFWANPRMTLDHLVFSSTMTAYIFIGLYFEEREMLRVFGTRYQNYQSRTGKVLPKRWGRRPPPH